MWLGRRWALPIHLVVDAEDGLAHEVRAVQRRPLPERWSLEALQAVTAVPRVLRGPATAGDAVPIEILPPAERHEDVVPPAPMGRAPNRVFIEDADLQTYGYTAGCPRCMHMRAGLACRGVKHREHCRKRIEQHLRDANDPRIVAADQRWAERVVAMGDPTAEPRAEEGHRSGGTGLEEAGGGPATAGDVAGTAVRPEEDPAADGQPASTVTAQAGTAQAGNGGPGSGRWGRGRASHGWRRPAQ